MALQSPDAAGTPVWRATRVATGEALLANATAAHALDYDDSHFDSIMHLGAIVVPVALAEAERQGSSTRDLLAAVVCGYQVGNSLARVAEGQFQTRGFQPSAILGVLAGVVTAARLRRLPAPVAPTLSPWRPASAAA